MNDLIKIYYGEAGNQQEGWPATKKRTERMVERGNRSRETREGEDEIWVYVAKLDLFFTHNTPDTCQSAKQHPP
jgi:hypothetical protein